MELKYSKIHYGIAVSDLNRSIEFYQRFFGFEEVRKTDKPHLRLTLAVLQLGDSYLELIEPYAGEVQEQETSGEKPEPKEPPEKQPQESLLEQIGRVGTAHIGLKSNDIDATYKRLQERGVEIVTPFTPSESRFFFCRDPDGFLIEIGRKL